MRVTVARRFTSALVGLGLMGMGLLGVGWVGVRSVGLLGSGAAPVTASGRLRIEPSGSLVMVAAGAPVSSVPVDYQGQRVAYPKHGQRGAAVWTLQLRLVESGLLRAQFRTGYFGARTVSAVKALERRYQQKATGRVTASTMAALAKAVRAATGPRTWYHQESIGTSADGRRIMAYRAGQPGARVVVVTATMHGEEDFGQYVAHGLLEGRKITGVDLWVVPVLNPDGLAHDRRWVAHHVDLNRNFPNRFVVRANSGPRASSAKETRVITAFLNRVNPRYLVSWHQPLDGVDSYGVKDRGLMHRLSKGLKLPVRRLDCHGSCHGTMTGWFNAHHPGAAITVEYGSSARSLATMKGRDANAVLSAVGGRRR